MNPTTRTGAYGLLGALLLLACTGCYDLIGSGAADPGSLDLSPEGEAAYRLLAKTDFFGTHYAGIAAITSEEAKAFAVLYEEPAEVRDDAFGRLFERATLAGQIYGLSGLYLTDRDRYEAAAPRYRRERREVESASGCTSYRASAAHLTRRIDDGLPLQMLRAAEAALAMEG